MNTPAHLLLGAAAFGRSGGRGVFWAAMAGGLMPDMSLYVLAGVSIFVLQIPPQIVFNELYFSQAWQTVFAIDNSVFVWAGLLLLALWAGKQWAVAFSAAALLHIALDLPLHHDDGRPHFWPVSDWVFASPVSYWDTRQGAAYVAPLEAALATLAGIMLWRARLGWFASLSVGVLVALEFWTIRTWLFFFVDSG